MEDRFDAFEQSTVGANWQLYVREFGTERVELQIWDTAGQERFRSLGPLYFRGASGAVVVYDIASRSSFTAIDSWVDSFMAVAGPEGTIALAGNKCDLEDDRQVPQKEALDWARERGYLAYETSAKSGQNVKPMIDALAQRLLEARSEGSEKIARLGRGRAEGGCC
jgi:small GTP-binding protein